MHSAQKQRDDDCRPVELSDEEATAFKAKMVLNTDTGRDGEKREKNPPSQRPESPPGVTQIEASHVDGSQLDLSDAMKLFDETSRACTAPTHASMLPNDAALLQGGDVNSDP